MYQSAVMVNLWLILGVMSAAPLWRAFYYYAGGTAPAYIVGLRVMKMP